MIRTPWPSRSAPHHWIASPRCSAGRTPRRRGWVKRAFSRWRYSKASRWRVGGIAGLGTGDVEAADALVAIADREFGDLRDFAACRIAVSRATIRMLHPAAAASRFLPEAGVDRLDDLLESQARVQVLLGSEAGFGIHHAVGGEVEDLLAGDSAQPVDGLHDRDGVDEGPR